MTNPYTQGDLVKNIPSSPGLDKIVNFNTFLRYQHVFMVSLGRKVHTWGRGDP